MTQITFIAGNYSTQDLVESFDISFELASHLDGQQIFIEQEACPGYYDIRFKYLIDTLFEKPLCLEAVSIAHLNNFDSGKALEEEKKHLLMSIFDEMSSNHVKDPNVLTHNLLDIIINTCND